MDKKLQPTYRFLIFVALIAGLWFLGRALHIDLVQIKDWLAQYPLWLSGSLFILIYVVLTSILWVGTIDIFRVSGALLFGPYWSTLFVTIAEIGNASILFLLSRKLGREFIEQKFHLKDKDRKYSPDNAGFWTALVLRINPLVPFHVMDVGFGLTKLSFRKYFYAVVLGSPLRIFWLQFVIAGMGEAILHNPASMMEYFQKNPAALGLTFLYMLAVVVITVGVFIATMIKKNVLQRQLSDLKRSPTSLPRTP